MSQVSRRFIKKDIEKQILEVLQEAITTCHSKNDASLLIEDLLTPTEKIMLAKRLMIAYFLLQGYPYASIENTLKVSKSTIGYIAVVLQLKGNGMRYAVAQIQKKEELRKILKQLSQAAIEILTASKLVHRKRNYHQ